MPAAAADAAVAAAVARARAARPIAAAAVATDAAAAESAVAAAAEHPAGAAAAELPARRAGWRSGHAAAAAEPATVAEPAAEPAAAALAAAALAALASAEFVAAARRRPRGRRRRARYRREGGRREGAPRSADKLEEKFVDLGKEETGTGNDAATPTAKVELKSVLKGSLDLTVTALPSDPTKLLSACEASIRKMLWMIQMVEESSVVCNFKEVGRRRLQTAGDEVLTYTVTMPLTEDVDTYLALEAAQAAEAKLEEQADAGWTELASKMADEGVTATVEGPPPEQKVEVEVLLQADVSADDSLR